MSNHRSVPKRVSQDKGPFKESGFKPFPVNSQQVIRPKSSGVQTATPSELKRHQTEFNRKKRNAMGFL